MLVVRPWPATPLGSTLWVNSGGPMSRTRSERLYATVLGGRGKIRCPRVMKIGLDFGTLDPLEAMARHLERAGIASPEELRSRYRVPDEPAICRVDKRPVPLDVAKATAADVLFTALVLGLCTPWLYDPARPVVWTRASLTRRLELFDGEGFYA